MKHVILEGTSEPQDFGLRNKPYGGEMGAYDGSGIDVELVIQKRVDGELVEVEDPPTVAWLSQAAGTVRVSGVETLEPGNYFVNFQVTDSGGKIGYFPNGNGGAPKSAHWQVVAVPSV